MGPLYGTLFRRMARASKGVEDIDAQVLGNMLGSALEGLRGISEAQVGDKTLMDTLIPSVAAYDQALVNGGGFTDALSAMEEAAVRGKESTRDMVAKVGRSSRLGERSRGVEDPGAVSCCLLLCSMAASIRGLLRQPVAVS
jgi:dihydroxyacetone kinase-like protein